MDLSKTIDPSRRKGRGAGQNPANRFESHETIAVDDGWDREDDLPPIRTEVRIERPRKVINKVTSPDLSFDRSINPYRGCEHGCIYCFARPSHAYLGLSPGLDFETVLIARPEAPQVLARELSSRRYKCEAIAIGTNTDPYQPIEKDMGIMREILEVLREFRHPVGIVTKGTLIERDLDILAEMAADGLAKVGISITSLDADLARKLEPRVPTPKRRLAMIERLAAAGVPVRLMASPIIPGLTDHEIERIVKAGSEAGALAASMITLRLPLEVAPLFEAWLQEHYPNRAARVLARMREIHGGKAYVADWGRRMTGKGIYATLMQDRFARARKAAGLIKDLQPLRTDLFAKPLRDGNQLSLF